MFTKIRILIIVLLLIPSAVFAFDWGECPFGNVNDVYPGLCGRYRDLDKDGWCDLSQTRPKTRDTSLAAGVQAESGDKYNIIFITVLTLLLYSLSEYLVYLNKNYKSDWWQVFTAKNVRWFWNVVLLWCFLIIVMTSIVDLAQVYGFLGVTKIKYSFWHIEAGLVMIILLILHIIKRWRSFLK